MDTPRVLLRAGVAVPFLYFGNLILSALLYPGYSHVRQYASELGSASARHPWVFNTGVVLVGLAGVLGGVGLGLALRRLAAPRWTSALVALLTVAWGVSIVLAGLFPMPDPRHGGYGLGLGLLLVPALLAWGIRHRPELRGLQVFLWAAFVAMGAMFAIMMGVGQLVTRANVGLFQRVNALATFPWIGIAAWRLGRDGAAPRAAALRVAA